MLISSAQPGYGGMKAIIYFDPSQLEEPEDWLEKFREASRKAADISKKQGYPILPEPPELS